MRSPAKDSPMSIRGAPGELRPTSRGATPIMPPSADLSPATAATTPVFSSPGDLDNGQATDDAQARRAVVDLDGDHDRSDAQAIRVPGSSNGTDQGNPDDQTRGVGAEPSSNGHESHDVLTRFAVGSDGNGHPRRDPQSSTADPSDALLVILADQLDDLEKARIAAQNRLRSLAQVKGLGGSKAEATLQAITEEWVVAEKRITLELKRAMRAHRFGPWVAGNLGLGEKQAARLIAAIGDPLWNGAEDRARRGPAELWAYCGYRPDQGKRKGQLHSYNWEAKMRAFLCAESCKRQRCGACTEAAKARKADGWAPPPAGCTCAADGFPFRVVYDRERLKWAESPKHRDKPDAHKEAHALRVVAKEILKSLWRYAASFGSTPTVPTPAATRKLRTARTPSTADEPAPSDLPATSLAATPGPTPSPVSSEGFA